MPPSRLSADTITRLNPMKAKIPFLGYDENGEVRIYYQGITVKRLSSRIRHLSITTVQQASAQFDN